MKHKKIYIIFTFYLVVNCGDPGIPSDGTRSAIDFDFKSVVRYKCREGAKLSGNTTRTCQASGQWTGHNPVCKGRCSFTRILLIII